MTTYSAKAIAVRLSTLQRGIVACGPTSFAAAAAIPVGLFACGEIWESDSGEEWLVRELAERGQTVRENL
ncbi:hypothetical protein [Sphingopyxis sp.]|uniref:hypothetical protein n=1 Tax=Sphingopyxis sp. TaxID=1908224 RepID=UPI001DA2A177|nr:hypothetical protein [Sphingopyxis sp.]MBW8297273.1 hypothetical protein [Sphingopyxis sp.]